MVADFECINLDSAYQLPILQFFNDLTYLKAKRKFDSEVLNKK